MSRIPKVTREHVQKALEKIDRDGVLLGRESRSYVLLEKNIAYPPKYVLGLAAQFATGMELRHRIFPAAIKQTPFSAALDSWLNQ